MSAKAKSKSYDYGTLIDYDRRAIYAVNLRRWAADVMRAIMERKFRPHVDIAAAGVSAKRADELAESLAKWPPLRAFWVVRDAGRIEEGQSQ